MGLLDGIAGGLASGIGGGLLGMIGAQNQNTANSNMADQQMSFQESMSNSSHQREVQDLRAAGLNPMLSVNAGASSPSGAMASMVNTMQPVQQGFSNAIDSAQKARGLAQGDTGLGIQKSKTDSDITVNAANKALLDKRTATESSNARAASETADQAEMMSERIRAGQDAAVKIAPYQPYIDTAGKVIGIGVNALEGGSAMGAAMKYMRQPGARINPETTGTFNKSTGEIHK